MRLFAILNAIVLRVFLANFLQICVIQLCHQRPRERGRCIEAAIKGREALKKARTDLETKSGGTTESGETVHPSTAIAVVAMGQTVSMIVADSSSAAGLEQVAEPRGPKEILEEFVEGWVQTLDRENKKSLAMLTCSAVVNELSFTETRL